METAFRSDCVSQRNIGSLKLAETRSMSILKVTRRRLFHQGF